MFGPGEVTVQILGTRRSKKKQVEVLANDVTFLDGRSPEQNDEFSDSAESSTEKPAKAKTTKKTKEKDVVIEDISDEPINLDDIPF